MSSALIAAAAELEATLRQAGTSGHKHEHHDHHKNEPHGHKTPAAGTKQTQGAAASGVSNCVGDCVRNWKLIFAFLLFVESIIFGFIPIILRRSACIGTKRFIRFVSFTNVASGGIFLATGLLHILPEASALLTSKGHSHSHGATNEPQFPTASAFLLLAYVLFLFFDRILFSSLHNLHQREHTVFPSSEDLSPVKSDVESSRSHEYSELDAMAQMRLNGFLSPRFCSGFLAVLGIAAHSLFESIALGTTKHFPTALNTFIAIASHRWATSLAIGSKLAHDRLKAIPYTTLVLAFSIVAPLGIGIGFAVNNTSEFFQGVIFALSAGIFIYIGASETIAEEFDDEAEMKFAKFFTMVGGIGLMLIITGILVAKGVHGHA